MKILFIACYSPLINNSAAIETLQYLNKLSEIDNNEIHLLTVDFPKDSVYYDETLLGMMNKNIKLHLIDGGKIFDRLIPRKRISENNSGNAAANQSTGLRRILRKIKNSLVIPDMYYIWATKAGKYGRALMEKEKFDVIFSMHEPPSSHLCAYEIKKVYKDVPWITYWSDPWLKDSTRVNAFFLKRLIERRMEKNIVESSDRFIFVTEANRQEYLKDYEKLRSGKKESFILNRGFDSKLYYKLSFEEVPEHIKEDKINIIYTGEIFSKLRDIRPFVKAIEEIREEDRESYNLLNILFFGNIDDVDGKKRLSELEAVRVSGRIPFNEALKYMLNGDVLLLFGNKNSKQIPAKIYDYFGAKGRILVIYGDSNDPIKSVVENNEKCINTENTSKEIKEKIYEIIKMHKNKTLESNPDFYYEWDSIVDRLNKILGGK